MTVSSSHRPAVPAMQGPARPAARRAGAGRLARPVMAVALLAGLVASAVALSMGPVAAEVVTGDRVNQPQPSVRDTLRAQRRDGPPPAFAVTCWQNGEEILDEEGFDDFRQSLDASSLALEFYNRTGRPKSLRVISFGETTCAVHSNTLELPLVGGRQ